MKNGKRTDNGHSKYLCILIVPTVSGCIEERDIERVNNIADGAEGPLAMGREGAGYGDWAIPVWRITPIYALWSPKGGIPLYINRFRPHLKMAS